MADFEILDSRFRSYVMGNAPVKQIATGFSWVEGPVWFGDLNCLLFSDIPSNRIMRWIPGVGVSTFREPSNFANGHTRDGQGRLISCQHGTRSVTRTEHDGTITTLAETYQGKRLNSPNDVVVSSDGAVWFTDPHYGIMTNYEGYKSPQELPCQVYRIARDGGIRAVATDFNCPNGLAFSPDEKVLYIADTGRMFSDDPQHIRRFDVGADGTLSGSAIFHVVHPGCSDGFRVDADGNVWTSAADGVHCIAPDGTLIGKIRVPELVSNVCFGGRDKHQLFITATTSVYMISLNTRGVQRP